MKRISIRVTGKVQGVYFRAHTEKISNSIGLTGFVRNEKDGSVYIEAQGSEEQLRQLLEWCAEGPERAIVEKVEHGEMEVKTESEFRITR